MIDAASMVEVAATIDMKVLEGAISFSATPTSTAAVLQRYHTEQAALWDLVANFKGDDIQALRDQVLAKLTDFTAAREARLQAARQAQVDREISDATGWEVPERS